MGFPESRRQAAGLARTNAEQCHPAVFTQRGLGKTGLLVIDLPPGTGDVQLTLIQTTPLTGAIVVTTPSDVSLEDARKAIQMFEQVREEVMGIVENMSYLDCVLRETHRRVRSGRRQTDRRGDECAVSCRNPARSHDKAGRRYRKANCYARRAASTDERVFEKLAHRVISAGKSNRSRSRGRRSRFLNSPGERL